MRTKKKYKTESKKINFYMKTKKQERKKSISDFQLK
jgi:hypothetical protein